VLVSHVVVVFVERRRSVVQVLYYVARRMVLIVRTRLSRAALGVGDGCNPSPTPDNGTQVDHRLT
jgi:hypothetical protein